MILAQRCLLEVEVLRGQIKCSEAEIDAFVNVQRLQLDFWLAGSLSSQFHQIKAANQWLDGLMRVSGCVRRVIATKAPKLAAFGLDLLTFLRPF